MPFTSISSGVRQRLRVGPELTAWAPVRCLSPAVVPEKVWQQAVQCSARPPKVAPQGLQVVVISVLSSVWH
jgi:hypothetical protein